MYSLQKLKDDSEILKSIRNQLREQKCLKCLSLGHLGSFGFRKDGSKKYAICPNCNGHGAFYVKSEVPDKFKIIVEDEE